MGSDGRPDKRLVKRAAKQTLAMAKDPTRIPVTLSLNKEGYDRMKVICSERNYAVSRVIDDLVVAFIAEYDDSSVA